MHLLHVFYVDGKFDKVKNKTSHVMKKMLEYITGHKMYNVNDSHDISVPIMETDLTQVFLHAASVLTTNIIYNLISN